MRLNIRCDVESEKFCKIFQEVNKALWELVYSSNLNQMVVVYGISVYDRRFQFRKPGDASQIFCVVERKN